MSAGYENAPATRMLATHCAACGRPLVDSASVESGLGPDCRRKYGAKGLDDVTRAEANKLVYELAIAQTGTRALEVAVELRALGLVVLADRVLERCADVRIEESGGELVVSAPYREEAVVAWRRVPGRRWDRDAKAYRVPASSRRAVWELLIAHYPGAAGVGPKGVFQVAATKEAA